jgi:hypothetical protein
MPEDDAVVAITSQSTDRPALLQAVWDNLLPAFKDGAVTGAEADGRLGERLGQLALPVPASEARPPSGGDDVWAYTSFAPEGGVCAAQPAITGVTFSDGPGGWRAALHEGESSLSVELGTATWAEGDGTEAGLGPPGGEGDGGGAIPVASAGGWTSPETLRLEVIFLETPHRLVVTCKMAEKTFEADWVTVPFRSPLFSDLRAPRSRAY